MRSWTVQTEKYVIQDAHGYSRGKFGWPEEVVWPRISAEEQGCWSWHWWGGLHAGWHFQVSFDLDEPLTPWKKEYEYSFIPNQGWNTVISAAVRKVRQSCDLGGDYFLPYFTWRSCHASMDKSLKWWRFVLQLRVTMAGATFPTNFDSNISEVMIPEVIIFWNLSTIFA